MSKEVEIINQMAVDQAVILNKLGNIEKRVDNIDTKLEREYVTQDQFAPIQKIVYGMVTTILLAVVGAIVALVIKQ